MPDTMRRPAMLRLGLGGAAAGVLSACGGEPRRDAGGRILLAHFSRPGENDWNGGRRDLEVGNTEVLTRAISARLDCDVHRVEPADPYAAAYAATVQRNVREQDADARPGIVKSGLSFGRPSAPARRGRPWLPSSRAGSAPLRSGSRVRRRR